MENGEYPRLLNDEQRDTTDVKEDNIYPPIATTRALFDQLEVMRTSKKMPARVDRPQDEDRSSMALGETTRERSGSDGDGEDVLPMTRKYQWEVDGMGGGMNAKSYRRGRWTHQGRESG